MKKLIKWLAKVFKVNITETKIVEKEIIKYIQKDDVIEGNITVKGNLNVDGYISVTGNVTCKEIKK